MRNTPQTLQWYRENRTFSDIGFDPDGRCLQVVRTARNIGSMFPTALSAQLATPEQFRVYRPENIEPGMVGFFDDPQDDNPFGHVVTFTARDRDARRKELSSLFADTNSVEANRLTTVSATFFPARWGDSFQFAATWLNGQPLLGFGEKAHKPLGKAAGLKQAVKEIEKAIKYHDHRGHDRLVNALERDLKQLKNTIRKFSKKEK